MKKVIVLIIFLFVTSFSSAQNLLVQPQKIIIDTAHDRYLVSNYGGNGDLVQIDNRKAQSYFVENAGMVDAMQIVGNVVYGSALNGRVFGFDLDTGEKVMNLNLSGDGVQFLSGFVADSAGFLYTSERFGTRIFKIDPVTQTYWVFVSGQWIDQPNGMLYEESKNRILVCLDKTYPPIMAINLSDSSVSVVRTTTLGGSDGIASDNNGNYYITGYYLPGIYKTDLVPGSDMEMIYEGTGIVYPTYNIKRNSLLVTLYNDNDWREIILATSAIPDNEVPNGFKLNNNYPNPFNPSTQISFELPIATKATLTVYDTLGEAITTLVDENLSAGNHTFNFDAGNLSTGVYYYKLVAGKYVSVKKMMLIK
ncbi:MAG: T9SS type A sorting domain-containing protein [Bacteroidetes bacterium]|nr:T9SS type A sorting domain-containing protein [Bacteroidota bacterium]